jgi:3-hydroxyacyl-CoA dehydrogenase
MFRCNIDDSDVLVVTIDDPDQSANTMNARFLREFPALVDHLTDERERIAGVVITSAKRTFCAGGDLDKLMHATAADAQSAYDATIEFHTATRQLGTLGSSKISTNLIKSRFFDLQSINRGANRPEGHPEYSATKLVVLGAGMMGAAIIYVSAKAGIDVVLKDITRERADKGKDYSAKLLAKAVEGGRMTAAERNAVLARILPTDDPADAAGADVAIEAVFEDPDLKKRVIDEVIPYLASDALIASNTSTLPITELADVARQIGKTSIVVNDSRGFFTSRVIATFLDEAVAMIGEGVPAASIERAANQAGYPVGPLGVVDEVSLTLSRATRQETISARRAAGIVVAPHRAGAVIDKMIDQYERSGRAAGAGSYEYAVRAGDPLGIAGRTPGAHVVRKRHRRVALPRRRGPALGGGGKRRFLAGHRLSCVDRRCLALRRAIRRRRSGFRGTRASAR